MALDPVEVVLPKIVAVAGSKGDGAFMARISMRKPNAAVPTTVATFNEVSLTHLNQIEGWLPKLVGGGEYAIAVNHASDVGIRYVFAINLPGPSYEHLNIAALSQGDWTGPTAILNAAPATQQAVAPPPTYTTPLFAQQPVVQAQRFGTAVPVSPAGAQMAMGMNADAGQQLLTIQREEARANASLQAKEAALNQREIEDRMRREAQDRENALKSQFERSMNEMKAMLVAQKPAERSGPSIGETVAAIAAAAAPILAAIMTSNAETRRAALELQAKQAEAAAQNAKELAALQLEAQKANQAMMFEMMKPRGQSPEMAAMLDLNRAHTESQGAMMAQIVNATGMVSKMSIGMIETIADMSAPPEGSPMLDAVKEAVKGLAALSNGAQSGVRNTIAAGTAAAQKAAQINAQPPQPTQAQLAAAQERAKQVNATAEAQQRAAAAQKQAQVSPTPPANVVQFPAPQIVPPPPASPPTSTVTPASESVVDVLPGNAAFGEMPDGFDSVPTKSVVDELEDLIRKNHQPTDAVAAFFLDNLNNPSVRGALEHPDVQGDPNRLFSQRFGFEWLVANSNYVEQLGESLERIGGERGLIRADDEEEEEGDDEPETPNEVDPAAATGTNQS